MSNVTPIVERPYDESQGTPVSWDAALEAVVESGVHWLATTRSDGRPHLVPIWAVLVDGTLHFAASATTQKAVNLAADGRCTIGAEGADIHVVVEGEVVTVTDDAALHRVAAAYAPGWEVTVRAGAFHDAEGAPTAGPPPYEVYRVSPSKAFAFPKGDGTNPTRWRF
jgi:hypothetical protein